MHGGTLFKAVSFGCSNDGNLILFPGFLPISVAKFYHLTQQLAYGGYILHCYLDSSPFWLWQAHHSLWLWTTREGHYLDRSRCGTWRFLNYGLKGFKLGDDQ
jgi:hypothetical protein